ncbi:MAG TPA: hypothetical protein VKT17_02070 [Acidobacteriota bacterium]|nr:hypothetical protein [Acidobacteriota bacterium]
MNKAERTGLVVTIGAFLIILAAFAAYTFAVRPWFLNWGTTPQERRQALLGDDAWIGGAVTGTHAVTIEAPPEKVWPWLVQIGQDRAGFYSYTWLENLVLADIHNTYEIRPEWQGREAKDLIRSVKPGFLFGLWKDTDGATGWRVPFVAPGRSMTLKYWGTFALEPAGPGRTRFLIRGRGEPLPGVIGRLFGFWVLDPVHFVMEKRMMTETKRLAEGRPGPAGWLGILATLGFASAALGAALLIATKKRRGFWLLIPGIYAALVVWQTADGRAALTGFTALALVVAGFLFFKRRWWAYFGFLLIAIYAVLFLAADAWIVFGLVFLAVFAFLAVAGLKGLPAR